MFISNICILLFIVSVFGQNLTENKTDILEHTIDLALCKLSHFGLEYLGDISKTESGVRCQNWKTESAIHKVNESFTDEMFPERSMDNSKNYCRNPNRDILGPWCYTMDRELIDETCGIPLCTNFDCRLTGSGMDYVGTQNRANSGKKCLKWDKHRKKVKTHSGFYEQEKFSKRRFPDETRGSAKQYCRNPDGDIGGPWCFVQSNENDNVVEKEFCDIPFCDEQMCMVYTKNAEKFTHYTRFNKSLTNLTFSIKLWDPDSIFEANARLLLSLFALPLNGEEINKMQIGIEINISNNETALTVGNKDVVDYEPSLNILKSSEYATFHLNWHSGFVTLNLQGQIKPIFLAEYKSKKNLFGVNKDMFFYYSILGTNLLWAFPFCDSDIECEIHTTTSNNFERFWPLRKTETGYDLLFNIRAFHSIVLVFQATPTVQYPNMKIIFSDANKRTKIVLQEFLEASENILTEVEILKFDFWEWREFLVSFFGETVQVFWKTDFGQQLVLEAKHRYISTMRWYSPGSDNCVAYWTFNCVPSEYDQPPKPWPPECVLNKDEKNYEGTQSVTNHGYPCIPWFNHEETLTKIGIEEALYNWNYCRDLYDENIGTYCIAATENGWEKKYCGLRLCKSAECRMAGTGNDYIGKLNTTRSNRTCQKWIENEPHKIKPEYLNGTLYADLDVKLAENYCRDPNRNISGPWCYTTDKKVPFDLCNVRDCSKNEECIIMTKGNGIGRQIYILPNWKEKGIHGGLYFSLKEWDPDLLDGIIFDITPLTGDGFLQLIIGAENNEKVILYSGRNRQEAKVVKHKTFPHLIPAGKWSSFWLQIRKNEIMLGYQGVNNPLFEATLTENLFEPFYISFMSIQDNIIGVHFRCDECHTERTEIKRFTRIIPLGIWSKQEQIKYSNISFYLRGTGVALIPLMLLPGSGNYYGVTIGDFGSWVFFIRKRNKKTSTLKAINLTESALKADKWTYYTLSYTENSIEVFKDNNSVLKYISRIPILFYWFSIGAENGWVTWSANCLPVDIDGPPRDGGWSQWSPFTCTVSCGGGTGFRTRICNNPSPNIYGRLCEGPNHMTGACNEFDCGDISPETINKIRMHLRKDKYSYVIDEGSRIVIENDRELLEVIRDESPKAYFEWTRNGIFVSSVEGVEFVGDDILIHETAVSDTGVYICMLYRVNNKRVVIRVVSLAVKPKTYSISTRASYPLTITSNAVVLGYVYTDLTQKWVINDVIYIDYGITTLAAVSVEHVSSLNASHDGTWECIIEQPDLQLRWVTNIAKIQVKKAPNILTHLMEDEWSKGLFGRFQSEVSVFFVLLGIVLSVMISVILCTWGYLKWGRLPKRRYYVRQNNIE